MEAPVLKAGMMLGSIFGSALAIAGNVPIPADVSVNVQAVPTANLHAGDRIAFTISATNHGPGMVTEWAFRSSPIYDQLDLGSFSTDCFGQFFVSVVDLENSYYYLLNWYPPHDPVGVGETITCHVSIDYTEYAPPIYEFGYSLSSYLVDLDGSNNASYVQLQRAVAQPAAVPMDAFGALATLATALVALGTFALRLGQCRLSVRRRGMSRMSAML